MRQHAAAAGDWGPAGEELNFLTEILTAKKTGSSAGGGRPCQAA